VLVPLGSRHLLESMVMQMSEVGSVAGGGMANAVEPEAPDGFVELERLYSELAVEIANANPLCEASGRCCRFSEYGHTLFLSELEAQYMLREGLPPGRPIDPAGCPFQVERLCTAREQRPLGCRIFYCDPRFAQRQLELSEIYTRRLKLLHDQLGRDWRYQPLHRFLEEYVELRRGGVRGCC
jgi:Fe-S-cluster containining protein